MTAQYETNVPLAQVAAELSRVFEQRYGRPPRWIAAAPGRVNLIGEHTDYNDGFVFPMAIERYTVVAADLAATPDQISWHCTRLGATAAIDLAAPIQRGEPKWADYIRGVLVGFQRLGCQLPGLEVAMASTVPLGGGLSSSAALEVASATLLEAVTGRRLEPVAKALLCQQAEHEYAGMPCGIMDQFISVMGQPNHLLLLDCRSRTTDLVPLTNPELAVLIVNTNIRHELTGGGYAQRRAQCEQAARGLGLPSLREASPARLDAARSTLDPVVFRRARHVVGEIERTVLAAQAIRQADWPQLGRLMYASHASLRDDYEVSCPELDILVEIAQAIGQAGGVVGSRMTGGGFGGCTVSLVQAGRLAEIAGRIRAEYQRRTGLEPSLFVTRPASGAVLVQAGPAAK
jgi:galactokinase